jgi:hypothetical protein
MNKVITGVLKAYAFAAAWAVALVLLVAGLLFLQGSLSGERTRAAWQALRSAPVEPPPAPERKPADGLAERELILEKRTQELQKLDERTATRLALIRAEQDTLEAKRKEAVAAADEAKKAQAEFSQTKTDAELSANVPILTRMEAPGIVAVLRSGDDARFVRYLRALRPSKSAEVLEALRTDPQFEDEFRRVPPEAPAGSRPRFERLNEEFRKAP